jgi:hypothetical protein
MQRFRLKRILLRLVATDANGTPIDLNEGADTSEINYEPTAISEIEEIVDFSVYPNPASQNFICKL